MLPDYAEHDGLRNTCNCKRPGHCTRLEPCRHGRVPPSCARHHATSCKPVVVPCTTRVLNDSIEHEGGSSGSKCRSCGSCIEASRRRCRGCMSVGEADCEMTDFLECTNSGLYAVRNGAPPHSLCPYPQGLYIPLQTSEFCNGRRMGVTDVRTYRALFSLSRHLLGASLQGGWGVVSDK